MLTELGRALGRLPDAAIAGGSEQGRFLDKAVKELASPDGRVIPVRLTLFAEMLRHRDWSTKTLRDLGGMEGIGVTFLEETFSAAHGPAGSSRPPACRPGGSAGPPARVLVRPQRPMAAGAAASGIGRAMAIGPVTSPS